MSNDVKLTAHRDAVQAAAEVCELLAQSERHRAAVKALVCAARLIRGLCPKVEGET